MSTSTKTINKRIELINLIIKNESVNMQLSVRLDKYLLADISDYDFKIYPWIKYDYFKLY